MTKGGSRSLSISDGMILVAASAVAFMGFRLTAQNQRWDLAGGKWAIVWVPDILDWGACSFALALVVIRLRNSRPSRDRLWRQPGWLACFVVVTTLALETVEILSLYFVQETAMTGSSALNLPMIFLEILPLHAPDDISRAVIAIWIILALSQRWEAEPQGIDRLGRIVGWYWVARAVVSPFQVLSTY